MSCEPRYSTPRNPDRKTLGGTAARIAKEILGIELMPWQRSLADVALELDESGKLAYRTVIVLTPRQAGKTTLELVFLLTRCLVERANCVYTSHSGVAAREKLVTDWIPALKRSPIASKLKITLTNGHESVAFEGGGRISLVSSTKKSGMGLTLSLAIVDEAFSLTDSRLEQTLRPTMITVPGAQLVVFSTAGVPSESPWLYEKVISGRQLAGKSTSTCYVEYSAPEDADPEDPDVWLNCHPAIGHTIDLETLRSDFNSMPLPEARRAYLCSWLAPSSEPIVDLQRWRELTTGSPAPRPEILAIDVSPNGESASIGCAAWEGDRVRVGVLETGPGTDWVCARAGEIFRETSPRSVVIDDRGPVSSLEPQLIEAGVRRIVRTTARQMADACQAFVSAVRDGAITHSDPAELRVGIDSAKRRSLLDGFALSRKNSAADISPLVAVVLAGWQLRELGRDRQVLHTASELLSGPLEPRELDADRQDAEAVISAVEAMAACR